MEADLPMKLEPDDCHPRRWILAALLAAMPLLAQAQNCNAPLPKPGASAPANGEKFSMIADQCDVLAAPSQTHRAAQLYLYGRGAAVAVAMPADTAAKDAGGEVVPRLTGPIGGDAGRVLSLAPAGTAAAQAWGIDPRLLHAIAHVECAPPARAG